MEHSDRGGRLLSARKPSGFTLIEMIVATAIIAMVGAIMIPVTFHRLQVSRAEALVSEMENVQTGLQLFQRDVGRYPFRLDYLTALFDPSPSGVRDACGTAISTANKNKYRGPYLSKPIQAIDPLSGIPNDYAKIASGDSILTLLTVGTIGTGRFLQIRLVGPSRAITLLMDSVADGNVDANAGRLRYVTPVSNQGNTLTWVFPVGSTDC
jgi:prepilin-type N-terminal cleavage/methylation domain-containing protein